MVKRKPLIAIAAGGTGGHVFPGLAVARYLANHGFDIVWIGTRSGLEAEVVPKAGFCLEHITMEGLRNRGLRYWLRAPFSLLRALMQTLRILYRVRCDAVLTMGGYVAAPCGVAAWILRKPLLVHEQNARPGLTNRCLAFLADEVLCGFPVSFGGWVRVTHVGNPVREDILKVTKSHETLGAQKKIHLLITGGSQGAKLLNSVMPVAIGKIKPEIRPEVWHQCGRKWLTETQENYRLAGVEAKIESFIEDSAHAYAWADVVVCRAGAMTTAEVMSVGLPAIFVPYPYAADNHQEANARYIADRGGAIMFKQAELTDKEMAEVIEKIILDRQILRDMADKSRACAMPDATENIGASCRREIDLTLGGHYA